MLLGEPEPIASVVAIAWFGGSLLTLFLILVRGHRWLKRLVAIADAPANMIDPVLTDDELVEPDPALQGLTLQERVAIADAKHVPPSISDVGRQKPLD